jgi:DNA-directed RNA polymerase specialized sigma24 family protein
VTPHSSRAPLKAAFDRHASALHALLREWLDARGAARATEETFVRAHASGTLDEPALFALAWTIARDMSEAAPPALAVLRLRAVHGFDCDQIARITGWPAARAREELRRAREELRRTLAPRRALSSSR